MPHPDQPNANMRSTEDPHYKKRRRREIIEVVPRRHDDQPGERQRSGKTRNESDNTVPFWRDLMAAFEMCQVTIESNRSLRKSDVGQDWLAVIRDRIDWLEEDERKLTATGLRGNNLGCKCGETDGAK